MDTPEEPRREGGRGKGRAQYRMGTASYKPTIREAILHDALLPESQRRTPTQIAKDLGVRRESVWVCYANLRSQGILTGVTEKPARDIPGPAAVVDPMAIVDRVLETVTTSTENVEVMGKDERARKLSHIGRTAPAAVAVNAVTRLDEMERTSGITVGPPDPMSFEDKADRLAKLIMIAGKEVHQRALELTGTQVIPPESHLEPESSERDLHSPEPTPSSTT